MDTDKEPRADYTDGDGDVRKQNGPETLADTSALDQEHNDKQASNDINGPDKQLLGFHAMDDRPDPVVETDFNAKIILYGVNEVPPLHITIISAIQVCGNVPHHS